MTMTDWNKQLTQLIRQNDPTIWGNWSMIGNVDLGAYGVIDPDTAEFNVLGNILEDNESLFKITRKKSGDFSFMTKGVKQQDAGSEVNGHFVDPESGTDVKAGVKFSWHFDEETDLLVHFTAVNSASMGPVRSLQMTKIFAQLRQAAAGSGHLTNSGGIGPGFVVVTDIVKSAGGFMVGSQSANQSFSISGEAKATSKLMEGVSGDAKASYSSTQATESIIKYVFPTPNQPIVVGSAIQAPIAFRAVSFDNLQLLTNWAG